MVVLGIVGGVASGKSYVAEQFERLGAHRINADQLGHEVLQESEVREQLGSRWGDTIFDAGGQVDRSAVAKIVFDASAQGPSERAFLERVTHPKISTRMRQLIATLQQQEVPAVILDAALLIEADWDQVCNRIVFVQASYATRLSRARQRGWDQTEFEAREAAQAPLEAKRQRADWVVDNDRSPEETTHQVQEIWKALGKGPISPSV